MISPPILREPSQAGNGLADPNAIPPEDIPEWMAGTNSWPEIDEELLEDMADYYAQIMGGLRPVPGATAV